jgi:hypothetical protein
VVLAHHASAQLPSREQWWMEVGAILEGNIVELEQQPGLDLDGAAEPVEIIPLPQSDLFGAVQPGLTSAAGQPNLHDRSANCASAGCASTFRASSWWRASLRSGASCTGSCASPTSLPAAAAST